MPRRTEKNWVISGTNKIVHLDFNKGSITFLHQEKSQPFQTISDRGNEKTIKIGDKIFNLSYLTKEQINVRRRNIYIFSDTYHMYIGSLQHLKNTSISNNIITGGKLTEPNGNTRSIIQINTTHYLTNLSNWGLKLVYRNTDLTIPAKMLHRLYHHHKSFCSIIETITVEELERRKENQYCFVSNGDTTIWPHKLKYQKISGVFIKNGILKFKIDHPDETTSIIEYLPHQTLEERKQPQLSFSHPLTCSAMIEFLNLVNNYAPNLPEPTPSNSQALRR